MKKALHPMQRVGSVLNEQFEQVLSQNPVIKAHVAMPHPSELLLEVNTKLICTWVVVESSI